jgi:hypothetical protein
MNDRPDPDVDLGPRLARDLPRYTAPARLRVAVVEAAQPTRRHGLPWLGPLFAAAATALVLVLFGVERLPTTLTPDATELLLRSVVNHHSRAILWGARSGAILPGRELTEYSGLALPRYFAGDDLLTFLDSEPVYLNRSRGAALHYRDSDGHLVTYVALRVPDFRVPDRYRVAVTERMRPALMRESGFSSWVWRQGDVACFIVSDRVSAAETERLKQYFLRMRPATEPLPAS